MHDDDRSTAMDTVTMVGPEGDEIDTTSPAEFHNLRARGYQEAAAAEPSPDVDGYATGGTVPPPTSVSAEGDPSAPVVGSEGKPTTEVGDGGAEGTQPSLTEGLTGAVSIEGQPAVKPAVKPGRTATR